MHPKKPFIKLSSKHLPLSCDALVYVSLFLLSVLAIAELLFSIHWRMVHDTPLMFYMAFLVDKHGYALYRDIFMTSMPGTIAFHLTIGKLLGYGDVAFRLVDITWLLCLLLITWKIMTRLDKRAAWGSVVLFCLTYLGFGESMSMQRDYIGILPISLATLLAISSSRRGFNLQIFLIGILFGFSASIKPQLALSMPIVLCFCWLREARLKEVPTWSGTSLRHAFQIGMIACAGFALPITGFVLWIWFQGGLSDFLEIVTTYLPLHLQLTGAHKTISGLERIEYLIRSYLQLGGASLWIAPATLGVFAFLSNADVHAEKKRILILLIALTITYSLYPVLAGQFWLYHWMPFLYFMILLASLALLQLPNQYYTWQKQFFMIALLGVAFIFTAPYSKNFAQQIKGAPLPALKDGRVEEISTFLIHHVNPGDKVQALDWTRGAVHAMLRAKVEMATPFIYDYQFYHHVSNPYIQQLRQQFIQRLKQVNPRFVIDVFPEKVSVSGDDTTNTFVELSEILEEKYSLRVEEDDYFIYEIKAT